MNKRNSKDNQKSELQGRARGRSRGGGRGRGRGQVYDRPSSEDANPTNRRATKRQKTESNDDFLTSIDQIVATSPE